MAEKCNYCNKSVYAAGTVFPLPKKKRKCTEINEEKS
jgi:phage FluMu protein Com